VRMSHAVAKSDGPDLVSRTGLVPVMALAEGRPVGRG
jgi:hypothetical protein